MSVLLETMLSRNEGILYAPIDSESAVMMSISSGSYYGLNGVAARIWEMLEERPMTVAELCAEIFEEFEVDIQTCETAVLKFANTLIDYGVVHAAST
jgi:hypothetical protein